MDRTVAILITLIAYKLILLGIGLFAQRRTRSESDFFLGGRRLGPLVASISASASSSSAWTLLGVSGYAFSHGLAAVWLFPACVGGFALNWYLVAPRLQRQGDEALTLTEFLAGKQGQEGHRWVVGLASVIVLLSLMTYVASQFQGAGLTFSETFEELSPTSSILIGAAVVVAYTMLGGFWAVSITDTLQGLLMALTAFLLPLVALIAVGGFSGLWEGLQAVPGDSFLSLTREYDDALALGLVLGLLGIGIGYPGQPHVVNRFMALAGQDAVRRGRLYALVWAVVVYAGMILLGLCGRVLIEQSSESGEAIFIVLTNELFHPIIAGIMIAAVLSAIMSTADSQLLVAASAASHDLRLGRRGHRGVLTSSRLVVLGLSALAVISALFASETIFKKVLFAWSAMGAAFGPLLLVTLWRGPVPWKASFTAMASGFLLSISAYYFPLSGVAVEERILPFVVAFVVAWWGQARAARGRPPVRSTHGA